MKRTLAIAALALFVAGCSNNNYEKTKSGLAYKIIKGKGGESMKKGGFVKFIISLKLMPKDSVLYKSANMPEYTAIDTSNTLSHDFMEVLKLCNAGDSLVTVAQYDTLVKKGNGTYTEVFKRGDQIITSVRILKVFSNRDAVMADQQEEMKKETEKEVADLEKMLASKGIKAQKTANGVFVETVKQGTGDSVKVGKQVDMNYTGSLIETGKSFDSNIDTAFHHAGEPLKFVVGQGKTIKGWEEGIAAMNVGGKANLYIPAMMGYGPQGSPPVIPRFAALKFEVEVLKMEDAPAPKAPPMMPGNMQGNPQGQQAPPTGNPGH